LTKYALDANLFIDAFRDAEEEVRLLAFHRQFAPVQYLSVVVALELRAGVRTAAARARLERHVLRPFEERGRVIVPGRLSWDLAGDAMAQLRPAAGRAFYNDVLIAASCREHGVTLVTRNLRDFARISEVLPFDFVAAWP
jgi:predicted nucleic acid-binding protein